ncbi:hypothetical protein, partial [Klebsiella pneumoniae]|uniref:hypothetical protein n=1 Tax=Klebsiella pneumoniae TaxID=573 RepID=UPI00156645A7
LSLKRVKTLLNDKGYQEVITYSFVDPKVQQLIHAGEEALILPIPPGYTPVWAADSCLAGCLWPHLRARAAVSTTSCFMTPPRR